MLQASVCDGLSFDPFPFGEDGLAAPDVDVRPRQVAQALVVAPLIVVGDEGANLSFEAAELVSVRQSWFGAVVLSWR